MIEGRNFRGREVLAEDVARAAPWRCLPVAGLEPLTVHLKGASVRLKGSELARYAGFPEVLAGPGWPQPGDLAGAVFLSDTYTSALITSWPSGSALRSHRLVGLQFDARGVVELQASKPGTVRIWPCVAQAASTRVGAIHAS